MILHRLTAFLILLVLLGVHGPRVQAAPNLVSVYPLGGQRGTTVDIEIRGAELEGAYAVWFGAGTQMDSAKSATASQPNSKCTKSPDGMEASVKAVQGGSAKVRLVISPSARAGFHSVSLVSPRGVSGAIPFWVGPHAVIQETGAPHNTPDTAQPVKLPVAVNGRISESGELDYYAFDIAREQAMAFEVIALHGADFDPQLALYEAGGSFLDLQRAKRFLFREEITQGSMPASRRMTHHFTKPGRYLVNIGNLFARGAGDYSYLLAIAPAERQVNAGDALSWAQQRIQLLRSKTVGAPATDVGLVREAEPDGKPEQTRSFTVPAVLEGTIGQPGDIDRFRFKAKAGQSLVFEIETPRASRPHFNPRLDVLDAKGAVVLSNLQVQDGKVGTESAKVILVGSQVTGKLDRDGEYFLRIRDLTSVHGSPEHVYRVLVRPQIPHIGDVQVQPGGPINLVPGGKQRLAVTTPAHEGFSGSIAIAVEGLPQGVKAFVGANNSMIELLADANAPVTPLPHMLRISGLPLLGGKTGSAFLVAEIPIMVVRK